MLQKLQRILIVRTDRIGDWILSTPVLETLHQRFPEAALSVLVNPRTAPLVEKCPYLAHVHHYRADFSAEEKTRLTQELRRGHYDAVLVLHVEKGLLPLLKETGIGMRIGPASKLSSYFYLTQRLRQKRSQSEKSEAEYNLDLLRAFDVSSKNAVRETRIWTDEDDRTQADRYLQSNQLLPTDSYLIIHPGSGGSALNWPFTRYRRLLGMLAQTPSCPKIVLAAGPGEENIVQGMMIDLPAATPIYRFFDIPNLRVYAELLRRARLMIAGSTGPLHLAHAVGTPTIGLYSPIRTQHPRRWGTYPTHKVTSLAVAMNANSNVRSVLFTPDVECPVTHQCLGHQCSYSVEGRDCMGRILVEDVYRQSLTLLTLSSPEMRLKPGREATPPPSAP